MSADPQQFVKFPVNVLEWRRHLSATKWTVLSVIHDKIARWDKESDAVSNSQIAAETTLSESSIRRAIAEMNTTDGPLEVTTLGTRGIPVYRIRPCDRCQSDRCQSDTPVNLTPLASLNGCQPDTPVSLTGVNVTPTTDVQTTNKRVCKDSLLIESSVQGDGCQPDTTPSKSTVAEDGKVKETTQLKNIEPVSLVGSPMSQVLFQNRKTGRVWKTGQDVECLQHELVVTQGEAEALLTHGQDAGQILTLFRCKEIWKKILEAHDRVAYMRGVIKNRARSNAAEPAKPTQQTPPPVPRAPLPFADVDDPIDLGEVGNGNLWHDGPLAASASMPASVPADAQEPAEAVEGPASPAPAVEASQELGAMPKGLTWEQVVWHIASGITDMKVMAARIVVGVDTIKRNHNLAVDKGALLRRTEGPDAFYSIAPGWCVATMKPIRRAE